MVSGRFLPRLPACRCANRPNSTNLVLVGSRVRPNFSQPKAQRVLEHDSIRSILEADHKVIDIAHQPGFAPQPALHHAFEPEVEHVVKIKVAQKPADQSPLRCSFLARIDLSIFQNTRFQPAPDQTDQAWITDPMRDEPEHPIIIENSRRSSSNPPPAPIGFCRRR